MRRSDPSMWGSEEWFQVGPAERWSTPAAPERTHDRRAAIYFSRAFAGRNDGDFNTARHAQANTRPVVPLRAGRVIGSRGAVGRTNEPDLFFILRLPLEVLQLSVHSLLPLSIQLETAFPLPSSIEMATAQGAFTVLPTGPKDKSQDPYTYQVGFGNSFASEAVPGTLPIGQNSPQKGALSPRRRLRGPT